MANLKDTTISGNLAVTGAANINNGAQISGGDVTFLTTGTGDSPALIFQRGALSDNYNDWKVVDSGGFLRFQQRGLNSTSWSNEVSFSTTGQIAATGFTGDGTNLTNVLHSVVAGTGLTGGTVSDGGTIALDTTRALTTADITTGTDTTNKLVSAKTLADALGGLGGGTVTSVGISNATNGGLSVSGSPVTSSGSITVGHSNVLTSAQTTQAVYPIAIDKNGHISSYGTAVAIPNNSNWVNGSATGSLRTVGSKEESSTYTIGVDAVAEGHSTKASGYAAHAEGYATSASGMASHAEGYGTASGNYSHAEGDSTASGTNAHAEGYSTASGNYSHAEGYGSTASGVQSHAEGNSTTANGLQSHAEGYVTIASRRSQHVFGEYNIEDTYGTDENGKGLYVEIVGKGTSDSARSNARTLDWNGNETLAGKLTLGAAPTANMDAATKQYVDNAMTVVTFTPDGTNRNLIVSVQQPSSIQNGNEVSY